VRGWRVMATQDDSTFLLDQIKLFMAYTDDQGFRAVLPLTLEMTEPIPDGVTDRQVSATIIPRELAEQLYTQLAYVLLGVSDPVAEIVRLRRDLNASQKNLTDLITAIGKIGGKE